MGNCQAAETDMLVIQHPGGKMERYYLTMTVSQVMAANPGHYVAVIVTAPLSSSSGALKDASGKKKGTVSGTTASVQLLKLLSPDDTLRIGHFYYLVTFEDVLKVFGSKKCIKLSKLLAKQERRRRSKHEDGDRGSDGAADTAKNSSSETVEESEKNGDVIVEMEVGNGIGVRKCNQWKPTLQSIAEVGQ